MRSNILKVSMVILILAMYGAVYSLGYSNGVIDTLETAEGNVRRYQNNLIDRYFEYIGNPANKAQQCTFEKVVYDDVTECY